jgi:hypothetical protein
MLRQPVALRSGVRRVRPPPWERLPILALARPRSERLKALGLMEERSTGVVISAEGRRVLRALITKS